MLRLVPTQIGLGPRDIAWHKDRHQARQSLRDEGHAVEVIGSPVRFCPETPDSLKLTLPYYFPQPPLSKKRVGHDEDDVDNDLFSNEPVPQGSKAFWDRILANAGTPPEIQIQHVDRRPLIVENPKASRSAIRSSKGSIEHVLHNNIGITEAHDYADDSPYPFEFPNDVELASQLRSRFCTQTTSFPSIDLDTEVLTSNILAHPSTVFTLSRCHRHGLAGIEREHHGRTIPQFSGSMELDGSSDRRQNHRKFQGRPYCKAPDSHKGSHRASDDSGERTLSNNPHSDDSLALHPPHQEPYKLAISPQLPVPRMVEAMRRRSSALQRSRLCISHAVASSSPEKQSPASPDLPTKAIAPATSSPKGHFPLEAHLRGGVVSESCGEFSYPASRRKKYTFRPKRDSPDSHEVSLDSDSPPGPASLIKRVKQAHSVISLALSTEFSDSTASAKGSPPPLVTPSPSSASHRRLNPQAIPFTPNNSPPIPAPGRLFPSSTLSVPPPTSLPLHPFSATPRSVSLGISLATPSPFARSYPSPSPYSQRRSTSPSSPHLAIYNDRLPAISQPQTPDQLTRHGSSILPSLHASATRVTQTVPAGITRGALAWQAFAARTPTRARRGRYDRLEDQENAGPEVEDERRIQRELARRRRSGMGRGRDGDVVGGGVTVNGDEGLLAATPE
jgi:hypothetical protein